MVTVNVCDATPGVSRGPSLLIPSAPLGVCAQRGADRVERAGLTGEEPLAYAGSGAVRSVALI